ncbi:hypothetical protein BKA64DRAFT_113466 [Cadophora sp. MPI-SDFR-AT-0126]|nr:hypothetical protein BKA64DRAFT_113466 [Leotiomycetes sp. MPI-SDFR-AT-0126]
MSWTRLLLASSSASSGIVMESGGWAVEKWGSSRYCKCPSRDARDSRCYGLWQSLFCLGWSSVSFFCRCWESLAVGSFVLVLLDVVGGSVCNVPLKSSSLERELGSQSVIRLACGCDLLASNYVHAGIDKRDWRLAVGTWLCQDAASTRLESEAQEVI